jgi:hypothetical protein
MIEMKIDDIDLATVKTVAVLFLTHSPLLFVPITPYDY